MEALKKPVAFPFSYPDPASFFEPQAIEAWQEKATICTDTLENAWLHHEIGRAQLVLERAEQAQASGIKSKQYAKEASNDTWQLNAGLLIAQAQGQ